MSANIVRRRRRHSAGFKAEAVAACRMAGASVAGVALEREVNANLLRRWVKESSRKNSTTAVSVVSQSAPTFMPVAIAAPKPAAQAERPIRVQLRKRGVRVTIEWPAAAASSCAAWLRELLG